MNKKNFLLALSVLLITTVTSCVKEYDCRCTYVPSATLVGTGQNLNESSTVKARLLEDARFECDEKESKYFNQNYDGDCTVD